MLHRIPLIDNLRSTNSLNLTDIENGALVPLEDEELEAISGSKIGFCPIEQTTQQMLQGFESFRQKAAKTSECQGIIAGTVASGESSLGSVILLAVNGCFNL